MNNRFFCTAMFLIFSYLYSQEESIQPDRPDQSESTSTVPFHYLQIEAGLLSEKVNKIQNSSLLPTILWKYGISSKTELRLITESELLKENITSEYNFKPITIGMKTALIKEKGWLPDIALLGHLEVLSKDSEGTGRMVPSFRFAFQNTLSETMSFSYNLGMQWNPDLQQSYLYTFTIGKSFNEKLGGFAEFYGFLSPHFSADHRFDAGFTYLFHNDLIVDISGGFGISKISPDYFISTGISYRLHLQ